MRINREIVIERQRKGNREADEHMQKDGHTNRRTDRQSNKQIVIDLRPVCRPFFPPSFPSLTSTSSLALLYFFPPSFSFLYYLPFLLNACFPLSVTSLSLPFFLCLFSYAFPLIFFTSFSLSSFLPFFLPHSSSFLIFLSLLFPFNLFLLRSFFFLLSHVPSSFLCYLSLSPFPTTF